MPKTVDTRTRPARSKRAEKQEETRRKLLAAAAEAVGLFGYGGASVGKITGLAGVAQGTFYNYFESQEDMFTQLLPSLGNELIDLIRARVAGETDSIKREEIGFRAFFDFLETHPAFYRVLNHAEAFAPKAYHDHMGNMATGYLRALSKAAQKGEITGFQPRDLEVLVYILLSARNYLAYRFIYRDDQPRRVPDWVVDVYIKFIRAGLLQLGTFGEPSIISPKRDADLGSGNLGRSARITTTAEGEVEVVVDMPADQLNESGNPYSQAISAAIMMAAEASAAFSGCRVRPLGLSVHYLSSSNAVSLAARAGRATTITDVAHTTVSVFAANSNHLLATGHVTFAIVTP